MADYKLKSFECSYCKKEGLKRTGCVNRALKFNNPLFCGKKCFCLSRKSAKTIEERKEEKRLYDIKYRSKNKEKLKQQKAARFKKDYAENPEKYRAIRKAKQKQHNEYCRTEKYRAYKKEYDRKLRCKKRYGEYAEAASLLIDLEHHLKPFKYQIKLENKTLNKALQRSRNGTIKRSYT